ncbi:Sugar kinase of the NBD/HSP70 family, may contain an N-terminal HTH domain [Paenibacillus sp. UNCCL117]|uniref:ROK family transcriptional regulator n=1 Tax=unclassified Paenibacillus TaxID=185978 RepID=UPI00088E258A|nr:MULTISPECIES: ROK family transcriptional regulator [unclassified Paenibacillus]SDD26424.1 Sugar kinase of the NBD/HSP70 family, may contain an N-terminal HTH domain [Paenibacillus sp. cl123]SFW41094.1 Sugar kinase of the NBD/HSP70 family, may contain an N-terminal HTH domain [Paenibacillus sp. UNCCL117]
MSRVRIEQLINGRKAKDIYEHIRKHGVVSKIDLLDRSGLTGSTLTRTLEELTAQGLIAEAGFGESTGGRRPILYTINSDYAYVFGLDISRMHSKLMLFDLQMNRLESKRWIMNERMTPQKLLGEIAAEAEDMLARRHLDRSRVLGLGIGAVGPLDRTTGALLDPLHFPAPGWNQVALTDYMEERLGFPCMLDNGANAALIAESWSVRERDYRHLLYVHVGVGIRSAMMTGGQLVYGAVDMEGSLGQMIIQTDGPRLWGQGNFGALESYVSIHALEQQAQARLKQGRESLLLRLAPEPESVQFSHLQQALQENDPLTVELFTQAATYFGIGLANLLNILHPEKVILGGALISSHTGFFHTATRTAIQRAYYYPKYQVVFSLGSLGEDALATGAALMVINRMTAG